MELDLTISIEGMATALGVLGAAIGYIVNLIKSWNKDRRDTEMRGASFVILEILEDHIDEGLTEDELFNQYCSVENKTLRDKYSAISPKKLKRTEFERRLRQLQFENMINPIGKDEWRINTRYKDTFEIRDLERKRVQEKLRDDIPVEQITEIVESALGSTDRSWTKKEALMVIMKVNPDRGIEVLQSVLSSSDPEDAVLAAEIITDLRGS